MWTAGLAGAAPAAARQAPAVDLVSMSLEELFTLKITSAGKRDQLVTETAAAIYVITADDIRRTNASTITELLRQVPGVLVARQATGEWAISIRGFTDQHANKLLVLMDGRTLYSPVYTGVEWDVQDTMLEDIDRIEIIRGPGAALWGANAVNGVINIITKSAAATRGGLMAYQVGQFEKSSIAMRYGGALGSHVDYRLFSKYFARPSLEDAAGNTPFGGWDSFRTGGRLDWSPTQTDSVTISGEWSLSDLREVDDEITSLTPPFESTVEERDKTKTGFLLTQWSRKRSSGSEINLRFFYDRIRQYDGEGHDKDESIETTDLELSHHLLARGRHDLVWGGGFRQVRDTIAPAFDSWFIPESRRTRTYNGFAQDEIALFGNTVRVTAGSKFEWNSFSKFEIQPTVRLLWAPTSTQSLWTAISRAVRVPSRNEHDQYELDSIAENEDGEIEYALLVASPTFMPERLTSYEVGYRSVSTKRMSLDVATFWNVYDDLLTVETGDSVVTAAPIAGRMTPLVRANQSYGRVIGAEVTAFWTVNDVLQLSGNYTRLRMRLHTWAGSTDDRAMDLEGKNAGHLAYVRAYADLPGQVALAAEFRHVGAIPGEDVPRYIDGNLHVSRDVRDGLRLSVTLDNMLHRRHAEWDGGSLVQSRALRASLKWLF